MAQESYRCIMNTIAFYICLAFYVYHNNILNGNTDMKSLSFQSSVLLGIIALLNRR